MSQRLIVSMTSFPDRIACVPQVLERLLVQTLPADEIVLYLAEEQFPGRESDLPGALRDAVSSGRLRLRWVEGDLKPHKKYIYAFREYPEDVVVTVDDDALYDSGLLKTLWQAHLKYPDTVIAGQTHLITVDTNGQPLPYASWFRRTMGFPEGPSMQLLAVGVGGVLYEPKWFPPELYDEEVIRSTCLLADDLWLKTMEMAAGIPVARSLGLEMLDYVPGSQEVALCSANLNENRNDGIFTAIRSWAGSFYGRDIIAEQLADSRWPRVRNDQELMDYINRDRHRLIAATGRRVSALQDQIKKLREDISMIRASSSYRLGNALLSPLNRLKGKKGRS